MTTDPRVEAAARAMAVMSSDDGCFERVDAWEAMEQWERDAHPDEYPGSDIEDCDWWRTRAAAALAAADAVQPDTVTTAAADQTGDE